MRDPLTPRDYDEMLDTAESIRRSLGRARTFSLVFEEQSGSVGNPIDPIFGEPVNVFDSDSVTKTYRYVTFTGSMLKSEGELEYSEAGMYTTRKLLIEVSTETEKRQGIRWSPGLVVMVDGVKYRISGIDRQGTLTDEYLRLILEKVT